MNGICAVACSTTEDCQKGLGGTCRVGFCMRWTSNELTHCHEACMACKGKMEKCRAEAEACISKC